MLANDGSYRDSKFNPIYLENQVFIRERLVEEWAVIHSSYNILSLWHKRKSSNLYNNFNWDKRMKLYNLGIFNSAYNEVALVEFY